MRIGVMLRDIGNQADAPGIIVLNLIDELLRLDRQNEYVLFYRTPVFLDRYSRYKNVNSVLVKAVNKLVWDQIAVPLAARRAKVDLLFHPKHSIPLLTGKKTVMQLRGPEYWINPHYYSLIDRWYQKIALKLFSIKSTHLVAESNYAKHLFQHYLRIPDKKISVIYLAASRRFSREINNESMDRTRKKYSLPERYIFTVTRVLQGKRFYPGKNIENMIAGYRNSRNKDAVKFVITGRGTREYLDRILHADDPLRNDLVVLDFVAQDELPALYRMAEAFLFPSINESFGIPIVEAMASGCPVITSNTTACREIAEGAAVLVNPDSVSAITDAIDHLVEDADLRATLVEKGHKRAENFSWDQSARQTLDIICQEDDDAYSR